MAKHRAKRNYLLIVGCTLSLASFFALLSLFGSIATNKPRHLASIVNVNTPYHSTIVAKTVAYTPDSPRKPTSAELAAWRSAAEEKARQEAEAARIAAQRAAAAAAAKRAAEEAAARAVAARAAALSSRTMSVDAYKAYAAAKLDPIQFSCLETMWNHESSWNPNAQNPTSTAYGIPQFLNSTWATVGGYKTSDPYKQIDFGLIYIDQSYGNACNAWAFWQANNYY